ncbi:MAG: peptidase M16 domain [Trebouxia sp. A1-2]|nr:MAG: peptidase M16 domain [Trebouxia sp. A1-2]
MVKLQPATNLESIAYLVCAAYLEYSTILSVSFSAALAAALTVLAPGSAVADAALPYQQADQTAATQEAKTTPLSQDKQSAATNSSSQLPPLPTSFPLLPEVVVQAPQEVILENGLKVFLLEDHEVPLVGLATISAGVQRAGGTRQHPGSALDEALELRAASIEGGASGEAIGMGFECLTEDLEEVLGLFSEVIQEPALQQDKVAFYKAQVLNLIVHRNDNAAIIPGRELRKLVYGRDSVFARSPLAAQIAAVTAEDVADFLHAWERPDGAVFGMAGDFDGKQAITLLNKSLGKWRPHDSQPAEPPAIPTTPPPPPDSPRRLFLVDRSGQSQASIAVGEMGIDLLDPDSFALDVLGDIMNGFGGRLFDEIRSKEGLAYSVSGGWNTTPADHVGLFVAGGETAKPVEFLAALQRVLQDIRKEAPSQKVLDTAKAQTLNSFVFNFASTNTQLQRILIYSLLGLPQDYLFQYKTGIEHVTSEDVRNAALRHLHPEQQIVVVAADRDSFEAPLKQRFGKVESLSIDN